VSCSAIVAYAEPDVGGMSFYLYVYCKKRGQNIVKLPRMVKSVIDKTNKIELTIVRGFKNIAKYKLRDDRSHLELHTKKDNVLIIFNMWVFTNGVLYPLLSDIDIVKGVSRSYDLADLKGKKLRERSGMVCTSSNSSSRVKDLRTYTWVINNIKSKCIEPLIYPKNSLIVSTQKKLYFIKIGSEREKVTEEKEALNECSAFPFGKIVSVSTLNKLKIYQYIRDEWIKRQEYEVNSIKNMSWTIFMNKIAVAVYVPQRYMILTLDGDITSIDMKSSRLAEISPYGEKIAVAYKDKVDILDVESEKVKASINLANVRILRWSPYGDYLLLCSEASCNIYSDLTESVVIGKPIENVKDGWWSPHTLSLYLQRDSGVTLWYFDPQMVRSKNLVVRIPTYLRNEA